MSTSTFPARTLRVFPKVNLFLEIIRRRDDGYHEIATVMQLIDNFYDELTIAPADNLSLTIAVNSTGAELHSNDQNLILRAARKLRDCAGINAGAKFTLKKNIPIGAGLGGGSADAAIAIKLCADWWQLDFSAEKLAAIAGEISSDAAFFLSADWEKPLAIATGRGEIIQPFAAPALPVTLIIPPWQSATASAYQALDPRNFNQRSITDFLARWSATSQNSAANKNSREFFAASFNVFETQFSAEPQSPAARLAKFLADCGLIARLSGSGSAMWTPKLTNPQAEKLRQQLRAETEFCTARVS